MTQATNSNPLLPNLLTRKEAAEKLRCGMTFLYGLRKKNKLPAVRMGKKVLFKESDVIDYLNNAGEGVSNG